MYGILKEELDREILDFGINYIEKKTCDEIYSDLVTFQTALENNQVPIPDEYKKELDDYKVQLDTNLKDFKDRVVDAKLLKDAKCTLAKSQMKSEFREKFEQGSESLKVLICWVTKNILNTTLKSCSSTTTQTTIKTDDKSKNPEEIKKTTENPQTKTTTQTTQTNQTNKTDVTIKPDDNKNTTKITVSSDNYDYSDEGEEPSSPDDF